MQTRTDNAGDRVDYDALREDAATLRHEAIDAFWSALWALLTTRLAGLSRQARRSAGSPGAQAPTS